jgi:Cdc6-like AAA superfamily ATPase
VVSQEIVPFQSKELVKTTLSTTPESQLEKTVVSKQEVEKEQSKIEQPIVEEIVESLPFQRKDKEFFLESLKEQKENISHYTPEQQRFLHLNNLF